MTYQPNFGPSVALEKPKPAKAEIAVPAKPEPVVSLEVGPDQFSRSTPTNPQAGEAPNNLAKKSPGFLTGLRQRFTKPQAIQTHSPAATTSKQASRFNHQNA